MNHYRSLQRSGQNTEQKFFEVLSVKPASVAGAIGDGEITFLQMWNGTPRGEILFFHNNDTVELMHQLLLLN